MPPEWHGRSEQRRELARESHIAACQSRQARARTCQSGEAGVARPQRATTRACSRVPRRGASLLTGSYDRRVPELHAPLLEWYDAHARDLPWRRPDATPWGVLVSEFMLQQTPVARVLPVFDAWLERWPRPADLAAEPSGEAIRAWGRLGYPRRAIRLHAAATAITLRHGGEVPDAYAALRGLPGVGDYTASAVLAFAFGRRATVLDTNVRRVLARLVSGRESAKPTVTVAERSLAIHLLPADEPTAATWSVALMELGALVCRA